MDKKIWINGRLMKAAEASISVFDRGFLYGDGLFETMRGYAGVVFKLDEHLERLNLSAQRLYIKIPYSAKELKQAVHDTLKACDLKSAYIRISVTRGEGLGISYRSTAKPNVVIIADDYIGYPERLEKKGLSVGIVETRQNERSPLTGIKSLNFLNHVVARMDAQVKGFDDAVLKNTRGHLTESATANIFLVKDNALMTPSVDSGILPGIARGTIIGIAKRLKIKLKEKAVSYKELAGSDEAFLTNSLIEVMPVVSVDFKKIGIGKPGDMTKLLHISYQKEVIWAITGIR